MIVLAAAASAATLTTCGDEDSAGCYPTIAEAVDRSANGDTIRIAPGQYVDFIVVPHDLVFAGDSADPPFVRDVGDTRPIFAVDGPHSVLLRDLQFTASTGRVLEASDGADVVFIDVSVLSAAVWPVGGMITALDADLSVSSAQLYGGAAGYGGQIYVYDGDLTLVRTEHRDAQATARGGAVAVAAENGVYAVQIVDGLFDGLRAAQGGAIHVDGAALEIAGGVLANNEAGSGGAVFVVNADVALSDVTFEDNQADGAGGALCVDDEDDQITALDGVKFYDNVAGYGGAAKFSAGELTTVTNSDFYRNVADSGGGAIAVSARSLAVVGGVFCGNSAGYGSAIATGGPIGAANARFVGHHDAPIVSVSHQGPAAVALAHLDAIGNSGQDGVVLAVSSDGGSIRFLDSLIANNTHDYGSGPLVYTGSADLVAAGNLFWENGDAEWFDGVDDPSVGFVGDPQLRGFDAVVGCAPGAEELDPYAWFEGPGLVYPTWYGAGRDRASEGVDPDGSPADVGAIGGPEALAVPYWVDDDEDGFPAVYDCIDIDDGWRPGAEDVPHDGFDVDCDRYSDDDVDHDDYDDVKYGGTDCNDTDAAWNPGAVDVPNDPDDQDCDGDFDLDNDGWVYPFDCDDANSAVNPGVNEDQSDTDFGVNLDCDEFADVTVPLVPAGCSSAGTRPLGWAWIAALLLRRRRG